MKFLHLFINTKLSNWYPTVFKLWTQCWNTTHYFFVKSILHIKICAFSSLSLKFNGNNSPYLYFHFIRKLYTCYSSFTKKKKNLQISIFAIQYFSLLKYPQIMQKKYQEISFGYRIQVALGVSTVFIDSLLGSGIAIDWGSKGYVSSL